MSEPNNGGSGLSAGAGQIMTPAAERVVLEQVAGLFDSGNPKHVLSAVGSAARNVATGATLGLTSLVGCTVAGSQDGVWGAVKGAGGGLAGMAAFTGFGLCTAAQQLACGLYNTPEALSQAAKGEQFWDSSVEKWVTVALADDLMQLPVSDDDLRVRARQLYHERDGKGSEPASVTGSGPTEGTTPGDDSAATAAGTRPGMSATGEVTDYYLFLGVGRSASRAEIKRAFTHRALEMHPDKNPNDPQATATFQRLLQVYNVLSNDVSRAEYDRVGKVSEGSSPTPDGNPMDDILGLGPLEPLVGRLRFTVYFEPDAVYDHTMLVEMHRRRRLRIARNLLNYLDNESTGFDSAAFALRDAVATRLGPQVVTLIAESYQVASRQHLYGSAWRREMDSWYSSKAMGVNTVLGLASRGVTVAAQAARGKITEEDIMALLLAANESDIRRTVLQSCRLVLYDTSASAEQRTRRAERLGKLSELAMDEVRRERAARATETARLGTSSPQQASGP